MVKERDADRSPDQPEEPDNTFIQPEEGPDGTFVQGTPEAPAEPGDTIAHPSEGATFVQGGDVTKPPPQGPQTPPKAAPSKPTSAGDPQAVKPKVFASRFEVLQQLGEGGMGVVYRAADREIQGREIALKVLRPRFSRNAQFRELFFKEIHAAQGFVSEHVVQVRDTGKARDGTLYLTMDLVEGEALDDLIEREGSLNERHALEIARQTLLALASGHDQGFIHRDIKPSNVMLMTRVPKTDDNPFGVGARVLDFGIAGLAAQVETGQIIGTPRYMSPEQIQGQRLDARSDLFSVGILLYEMLSGTRPFEGDTLEDVSTSILNTNLAPMIRSLDGLSDPIRKLLKKALQKDRDKRFQSASQFIHAIEKSKAFREARGVPAWVGGMLVVSLAGAGALGYLFWDLQKRYDDLLLAGMEKGTQNVENIDEIRAGYEKRISEANQRATDAEEKLGRAQGAEALAKSDKEQAEKERAALEKKVRDLEKDNTQLNRRMAAMESQADPKVIAAVFFDLIEGQIASGKADQSGRVLKKRQDEGADYIPRGEGEDHIEAVVESAAAFAAATAAFDSLEGDPENASSELRTEGFEALRRGKQRLADAKSTMEDFKTDSVNWIGEVRHLAPGTEVDRIAKLTGLIALLDEQDAALTGRATTLREQINAEMSSRIESFRGLSAQDDPKELIQHLRAFSNGDPEIAAIVDRLGKETEDLAKTDGNLDVAKLGGLDTVRQWGRHLLGDGASMSGDGAETFRWLWAARQWYDGANLDRHEYAFLTNIPKIENSKPALDWRARLALQFEFAKRIEDYVPDKSGITIFRRKDTGSGNERWVQEQLEVDANDQNRGVIKSRTAGSSNVRDLPVALRNGVLLINGKVTLDVRANDARVLVARWTGDLVEQLPREAWAAGLHNKTFVDRAKAGVACLVFKSEGVTHWFAPGFGRVRHEIAGRYVREMCYSSRVR